VLFKSIMATVALAALTGTAMANVTVSTVGPVTTYSENFNGGTTFTSAWFDTPLSGDDYLFVTALAESSSYAFSSAVPLESLSLSFWYSVPGAGNGRVSIVSDTFALPDTPGGVALYLLNNPGPQNSGGANPNDASFSTTLTNVAAGSYTVTFATNGGLLESLKVDDVVITTVAAPVPEPETYALMLGGTALIGWVARRRKFAGL
jgi:hypothetical protein